MKKILLYFILLIAISLAGIVAYISISGLLKVFAGAGTAGFILFSIIEAAKLISTSALHTYNKKIGVLLKVFLSFAILVGMTITSIGIYGFLSSSYKESYAKMEVVENKVKLIEKKRDGYEKQLTFIISEKETINTTIGELSKGLSNNVIEYKDKETGEIIRTTSSSTRRALEKQLNSAINRQEIVNNKADELNTFIFNLDNEILELNLNNNGLDELSTLKYLADVTDSSMDDVMKWFIILIMVVGDPMAIIMIIVFNKVVNKDEETVEGLPMDSLIGDNPIIDPNYPEPIKSEDMPNGGNIVAEPGFSGIDSVTRHIDLPEESLPMEQEIFVGNEDVNSDYVKQIQDNITQNDVVELEEKIIFPEIKKVESKLMGLDIFNPKTGDQIHINDLKNIGGVIDKTPEEQIDENVEDVKQLKREPIIPRGNIILDDFKKNDRGFTVDVPDPKITKIGSQKEVHEDKPKTFFFKRKRKDEL